MPFLYHERQEAALCGQHCLNNLCQGPFFTTGDLADIAHALDHQERKLMMEAGMTSEARSFMAQESSNIDAQGNFSIQVLSLALQNKFNIMLEDSRRPENAAAMRNPDAQAGFVLNRHSHWYCLRKLENQWYSCNSTSMAPEKITSSGNFSGLLSELRNLQSDNWTVFMVKGTLPKPAPRNVGAPSANWVDPNNPPRDPNEAAAFGNGYGGAQPNRKEEPKYTAFAGQGQTLGGGGGGGSSAGAKRPLASTDGLTEEQQLAMALSLSSELANQAKQPAAAELVVDEAAPTTTLQVRFMSDGGRKVVKANESHTVGELKAHIATLIPGGAPFALKAGFPPKPLTEDGLTLAEAKLLKEMIQCTPA